LTTRVISRLLLTPATGPFGSGSAARSISEKWPAEPLAGSHLLRLKQWNGRFPRVRDCWQTKSEFAPAPVRARARPGNARRNARPFDHVTLTVGAGAFTAAANPLAVPFRPEASPKQQRARQPALSRRCHAKLAVWLKELWSKRWASRLGGRLALPALARAGANLTRGIGRADHVCIFSMRCKLSFG
jgi:hypothetical protein